MRAFLTIPMLVVGISIITFELAKRTFDRLTKETWL